MRSVDPVSDNLRGRRLSLIGLLINGLLAIIKLTAGVLGRSTALVADAVESMADIFGSFVVWSGLQIARKPPDENHPYGHGRAEPIAALVVALMLIGAAIGISITAVREILEPQHTPAAFTFWVLVGVIVIKEGLFQIGRRLARRSGSSAVLADAWHHRSDAITSLAALIGIGIAVIGGPGYEAADDWAALLASAIIVYNAYRLSRGPLDELMEAEPTGVTDVARAIALEVGRVHDVEKVFARKSGAGYFVDMHIEVEPSITVHDAHEIAHEVKDTIRANMPNVLDVLVHVEPAMRADEPAADMPVPSADGVARRGSA